MKKFVKVMALMMVVVMSLALLASCGISEKTAEDINNAAKNGEPKTVEDLKKQLGDPTIDLTVSALGLASGSMIWVSGCKNAEDVANKIENDQKLKALVVVIAANKAVSATYGDYDPNANK